MIENAVTDQQTNSSSAGSFFIPAIVFFSLLVLLPSVHPVLGWLHVTIPIAVLCYLYKWPLGGRYVLLGTGLAGALSLLVGIPGAFFFTAVFIPMGFTLAYAGFQEDSPARSGLKGCVSLVISWALLLGGFYLITGINPISESLSFLAQYMEEALGYYQEAYAERTGEAGFDEQALKQLTSALPTILPPVIVTMLLLQVWFTMVVANSVVPRVSGYRPWADIQTWQLPDKLIWIFIGAIIVSSLPLGFIRLIGINVLIALCLIYFFLGFSILVFYLNRWQVPPLLRAFCYTIMLLQQVGTIILLVIGLADIWLDIRKLKTPQQGNNNPPADT